MNTIPVQHEAEIRRRLDRFRPLVKAAWWVYKRDVLPLVLRRIPLHALCFVLEEYGSVLRRSMAAGHVAKRY